MRWSIEVRGLAPILDYRNLPLGDVDGLVDAIVAISSLADSQPEIREAEANPVHIHAQGQGVVALDALIRTTAQA